MPSFTQTEASLDLPHKSSEENMPTKHDEYSSEPTKGADTEAGAAMFTDQSLTIFERKAALINA